MLHLNLTGCDEAVELYVRAFGAEVDAVYRERETGMVEHAEIRAFGQVISFSENMLSGSVPGNTRQFCFHFGEGGEEDLKRAYAALSEGASIDLPLGSCDWSPLIFGLTDRFGVNWLLFV